MVNIILHPTFLFFFIPHIFGISLRYGAIIQPSCQCHCQWSLSTGAEICIVQALLTLTFLQITSLAYKKKHSAHIYHIGKYKKLILTILFFFLPHLTSGTCSFVCSLMWPCTHQHVKIPNVILHSFLLLLLVPHIYMFESFLRYKDIFQCRHQ